MQRVRQFYSKGIVVVVSLSLLAGCASARGSAGGESAAQSALEEADERFNTTMAEGALIGAVLGAAIGAAAGGGRGAAIGALGGTAVGVAAGYAVARNNYAQAQTEQNLQAMIAEAQKDAQAYRRSAEASQQIAIEARTRADQLAAQYAAKTISAGQYRASMESYKRSSEIMRKQLGDMKTKVANLRADSARVPAYQRRMIDNTADDIYQCSIIEQKNLNALEATLASLPTG